LGLKVLRTEIKLKDIKMTKKRENKFSTALVKLAEIKYLLKMLGVDTKQIDKLIVEIRNKKETESNKPTKKKIKKEKKDAS